MAKALTKKAAAAHVAESRDHVVTWATRYGSVTATFRHAADKLVGYSGAATFERFPGVTVSIDRGGCFASPNGANLFRLRYPAVTDAKSAAVRKMAAIEVMEILAASEVEVR